MPQKLSEAPEESIRQFLVDNLRPTEMEGYNPLQTDPTASDFLPITNNWSDLGDTYPIIVIQGEGPTIIGGGETGFTGIQGDGSGANQYTLENMTVSVQAVEGQSYRNGVKPRELTYTIFSEVHHQIQTNVTTAISEAQWATVSPPTLTENEQETDSGSTITWFQRQGTAGFAWQNEP